MNDPRSDAAISRDIAQDAGQLLLRIRQDFIAEHGPSGTKRRRTSCAIEPMRRRTI